MPEPATQEAARTATSPEGLASLAALVAAVGLAWRRLFAPKHKPVSLEHLATKEDLAALAERLDKGFERMEEAGERRVGKLHDRLDKHLEQHGRAAA